MDHDPAALAVFVSAIASRNLGLSLRVDENTTASHVAEQASSVLGSGGGLLRVEVACP